MFERLKKSSGSHHGDFHVDAWLTNFSEMYVQDAMHFVSRSCATNVPVNNASDIYAEYPRGYFWRDNAKVRPFGGKPAEVSLKVKKKTYSAEEWALAHPIDDRQRANTNAPGDLDENGALLLMQQLMIRREVDWAESFFASGIWSADYLGGTDFTQFDDANSTPIEDVDTYKLEVLRRTGFRVNKIVLGARVWKKLRSNADIADRIKHTGIGVASTATLAELFDVESVVVAEGVYNIAPELNPEEDDNLDTQFIVDENSMWMGHIAPTAALNTPTAISSFNWTGLIGGANEFGGVIESFREDRAYSDYIHGRMAYDLKQVSADLGVFMKNAVAPDSPN